VLKNSGMIHTYMANSLSWASPEMDRIKSAVRDANIFVVLGYSERDGASLFMAQPFISSSGEIVHHHRKIKPTHVERSLLGRRSCMPLSTHQSTHLPNISR
jgi:nitrilase